MILKNAIKKPNTEDGYLGQALTMAIQALERQRNITNEELYQGFIELEAENERLHEVLEQQRWIPIKTRPLTEEEKEHFISIGWSEDSLEFIYNCPLPDDGQEVLITDSMGNVELDTFYSDDGCYFENNCDADEVIAWRELPQPYKEKQMENRLVIIHCPYTGRNYIYTKTIVNGKICVDIVRID